MEKDDASLQRLSGLEKELADLHEANDELKAQWLKEKEEIKEEKPEDFKGNILKLCCFKVSDKYAGNFLHDIFSHSSQ